VAHVRYIDLFHNFVPLNDYYIKLNIPVLLYGLEVWDLPKRTIQSLDFSVNRVLMKLFRPSNIEIIAECRNHFGVELPSVQLAKRFKKFSDKICNMIA